MPTTVWEGKTAFGEYQIIDTLYDGRPARVLYSDNRLAAQAGVPTDGKRELLFDYNQRLFELVTNLLPARVLLIGGSVCTLPMALLRVLPNIRIDVVEPDAELFELARQYFDLPQDERLQCFATDGRSYLRQVSERYDMILVDVYDGVNIPHDMRTLQAIHALKAHLHSGGIVAQNIISGLTGRSAGQLREIYAGFLQVFDEVDIFLASRGYSLQLPQNFILTAQQTPARRLQDYMRYEAVAPPEVNPNEASSD